jgi:hypothetical protein
MRIADRTSRRYPGGQIIWNGEYRLVVENRELYTGYKLESARGTSLWFEVRNCNPFPNYQPRVIYARTIPWFMWIIYGIRDWFAKWRSDRELNEWWKQNQARRKAIRELARKNMGSGRYGGRYNR